MDYKNGLHLQQEIIDKVMYTTQSYDSISGIFLTGSHAINDNTPFSDIDICLLFKTDERQHLEKIFSDICEIAPTLSHLFLFDSEGLFLFNNGVRLDVTFIKPSDFTNWNLKKVKIIRDANGLVTQRHEQTKETKEKPEKIKWNDKEGNYLDWYFWMFRQIYCYILQAELKPFKRFDKLDSAHNSIKSVRDKLISMIVYLNGEKEYIDTIDKNLSKELEQTYTALEPKQMLTATKKLTDIYEVLGEEYAKKEGVEFPSNKLDIMRKLFEKFDSEFEETIKQNS